jgi:hypothetical protein
LGCPSIFRFAIIFKVSLKTYLGTWIIFERFPIYTLKLVSKFTLQFFNLSWFNLHPQTSRTNRDCPFYYLDRFWAGFFSQLFRFANTVSRTHLFAYVSRTLNWCDQSRSSVLVCIHAPMVV